MHPNNAHLNPYNFEALIEAHPNLAVHVTQSPSEQDTIDFSNNEAVLHLNKALLKLHYGLTDWNIPEGYLCPPIPGRADYIHHIADLLNNPKSTKKVKGLDIGVGANCIYPILANRIFGWKMVGTDIDEQAVIAAKANVRASVVLKDQIEIRLQKDHSNIFEGVVLRGDSFDFAMCNPPFHTSEEEALKSTRRKLRNLHADGKNPKAHLNFGGQANELWCNGGEALFIKRMIKQSEDFKTQINWFTSLVSQKENLPKIYKQLDKLKLEHHTINMEQGNKKSRLVAWRFI